MIIAEEAKDDLQMTILKKKNPEFSRYAVHNVFL